MFSPEVTKRPRLGYDQGMDSTSSVSIQQPSFSRFLSNERDQQHPILSDKKLIVYDLKVTVPEISPDYEESCWNRLRNAIQAIQKNQAIPESQEVLYQLCENVCQYTKAETLYIRLREECQTYVDSEFRKLSMDSNDGIEYLQTVHLFWKNYCQQMSQIRCLFLYLDRTYIATIMKNGSIWRMAMDVFKNDIKKYETVWEKVLMGILDMINTERKGESIDESFLQSNIKMLMDLGLYYSDFEPELLVQTRQFYDLEGNRLLDSINVFDYLEHVSTRVHQESILRVKSYFNKSTKSHLQSIVENELLTKRVEDILTRCFHYFQGVYSFQDSDYDKFSLLYRLLQKVDKLEVCAKYFTNFVKAKGSALLCSSSNVQEKISMVSLFESQTDEIVDHSFEADEQFADGFKDGFDYFMNLGQNNAIRLLAKYIDQVLRNTTFDESLMDKGITLFGYIHGKEEFEVLYKGNLAKRLLLNVSNKNAEKLMLTKMKKECGAGYTGKMEGMVKDIEKSTELMKEFKASERPLLDIHVNLLTYGFWPSYSAIHVNLPSIFQESQELYKKFYMSKFEKRVLTWHNSLSVCQVNANYPKGLKRVTLTLLQTIVLLLFNDTTTLSFVDILNSSQLDELELRRTLVSLSCREYKLLLKYPEGDDIQSTDMFEFNQDFDSEKEELHLTTATLSEVIEKNSRLDTTILFAKEQQIDAVIVRIMKSKSKSTHGSLLSEVTRIVTFPVTAQDIKKRIEILIDKEYLERGPDDTYTYLA